MDEIDKIVKTLEKIQAIFGLTGVIIVISLVVVGFLLYKYLVRSVETVAEEASKKSLIKFQSTIDDKLETKLKLFFRNENIRNDITTHFAIKSIETKLSIWTETYQLYFDFQKTWHFDKQQLDDKIEEYDKTFQENREHIFLNSVYLGGFMTSKLITLNNSIRHAIRTQYRKNHLAFPLQDEPRTEIERRRYLDKIEEILPEVESWINTNLTVDHNTKMWDFSESELKIIAEQNREKFEDLSNIKEN